MDIQEELIAEYDRELASTRKMLDAIPADADLNWKASPKCMTLGRLAAHVAETAGAWGIDTLSKDGLDFDMGSYKPWNPASKAEILAEVRHRNIASKANSRAPRSSQMERQLEDDRWRPDLDRRLALRRLPHLGAESPHPSPRAVRPRPADARRSDPGHVRSLGRRRLSKKLPIHRSQAARA